MEEMKVDPYSPIGGHQNNNTDKTIIRPLTHGFFEACLIC
jgi:hypothetical protein